MAQYTRGRFARDVATRDPRRIAQLMRDGVDEVEGMEALHEAKGNAIWFGELAPWRRETVNPLADAGPAGLPAEESANWDEWERELDSMGADVPSWAEWESAVDGAAGTVTVADRTARLNTHTVQLPPEFDRDVDAASSAARAAVGAAPSWDEWERSLEGMGDAVADGVASSVGAPIAPPPVPAAAPLNAAARALPAHAAAQPARASAAAERLREAKALLDEGLLRESDFEAIREAVVRDFQA